MIRDTDNDYTIEKGDTIREFDCRVISIKYNGGGGFFTALPISPKEYRESLKHELPDKVEVTYDSEYTIFTITDDWGNEYTVAIDNHHQTAINNAINSAKEQGLLSPQ